MKVRIHGGNKKFFIPIPLSLASAFIRIIPEKDISKADKKVILGIIRVCKKDLKQYKGLEIVNIKTSSGEKIIIQV